MVVRILSYALALVMIYNFYLNIRIIDIDLCQEIGGGKISVPNILVDIGILLPLHRNITISDVTGGFLTREELLRQTDTN